MLDPVPIRSHNEPRSRLPRPKFIRRSVSRMLRALFLIAVTLVAAGPALAAGDIDTCRDVGADPVDAAGGLRTVIADDKITGKPKASAFGFVGDTLMKKRDYDDAIAAFSTAHDIDPDNVGYVNSRGIAYRTRATTSTRWPTTICACRCVRISGMPTTTAASSSCASSISIAPSRNSTPPSKPTRAAASRYLQLYNRARADVAEAIRRRARRLCRGAKLNPDGPQVPTDRCITYTEMAKFDEALADCNAVLAKIPQSVYSLTSRANAYLAKGDLDAALASYNQAIRITPNYMRAYAGRGQLFEKRLDAARHAIGLPRRQCRARQGRRHRHHAGAPFCQGAARSDAGCAATSRPPERLQRRRRRPVRAGWR